MSLTTTETGQRLVSVVDKTIADTVVSERLDVMAGRVFQICAPSSFTHFARQQGSRLEVSLPDLGMTSQHTSEQNQDPSSAPSAEEPLTHPPQPVTHRTNS